MQHNFHLSKNIGFHLVFSKGEMILEEGHHLQTINFFSFIAKDCCQTSIGLAFMYFQMAATAIPM